MNRDGCVGFCFFFFIWSVLLIQCFYFSADHLLLEREVGILPLNSGTIVVLTLFCYLHSLYSCLGLWILLWKKRLFPVSQFCFMYWLFKLKFGIKMKPMLSSTGS